MSPPSDEAAHPPALVVVLDTSVLIAMKSIDVGKQWPLLVLMGDLVTDGRLCFPPQVSREITRIQFPDAPGAWGAHFKGHERYRQPREESLAEVLGVAPRLVDPEGEDDTEPADPYVAAMAYEIRERYNECQVIVATNDHIDHGGRDSLTTACGRLGIECWRADEFVAWVAALAEQS